MYLNEITKQYYSLLRSFILRLQSLNVERKVRRRNIACKLPFSFKRGREVLAQLRVVKCGEELHDQRFNSHKRQFQNRS